MLLTRQPEYSYLARTYSELIDGLRLDETQKTFLRTRWLNGYIQFRRRADVAARRFYALRVILLVGGATTTAFASLKLSGHAAHRVGWAVFGLSLTTTIAAGLLELFRYSDTMTSLRDTAEKLEAEAWQFFTLSGVYERASHADAYPTFVRRSEQLRSPGGGAASLSAVMSARSDAPSATRATAEPTGSS